MYAVDNLSDAIDATRSFLTPVRPRMWVKLAIIVLFVSSLGGGFPSVPTGDFTVEEEPFAEPPEELDITMEELLLFAAILLVIGVVFWLIFGFIRAILHFVFLNSLMTTEVHVRRYAKANLGRGVHLFLFRVVVSILATIFIGVPAVLLLWHGVAVDPITAMSILLIILLALLVGLVTAVIRRFTSEFVAPVMLLEERGIVDGWRRFWPTLRGNLGEYTVYLLLIWVIQFAASIAAWVVIAIGGLIIVIPFAVVFVTLLFLGPIGIAIAVPVLVLAILAVLLWVGLVWTPIESYFTYYALLLLGDTEPELDLIPEQRAAIRSDGGERLEDHDSDGRVAEENDDRRSTDGWDDGQDDWTDGDDEGW